MINQRSRGFQPVPVAPRQISLAVQNPLRIDDENEPQPDLVLYDRAVVARHPLPAEAFLVIEVADASLAYDQHSKIPLYAAAGIKEVLIVDLIRSCIHTYLDPVSTQKNYTTVSVFDRRTWVSPREFPDIRIRLADVL